MVTGGVPFELDAAFQNDETLSGWLIRGFDAATRGDDAALPGVFEALSAQPAAARLRAQAEISLLHAWIAAREHRWGDVLELLEEGATQGPVPIFAGRLPIRWLVAEAYEQIGQLDQAARYFELVLSPTKLGNEDLLYFRAIPFSFAHLRLVLLYSRMGRDTDASRHWNIFQQTFRTPDPEFATAMDQARRAVAGIQGQL
jgi:hypothetical protein